MTPVTEERRSIYLIQVASVVMIWVFVITISGWILNLIRIALLLDDQPTASVAISLVAIPVFAAVASVLTYVFVGLQRARIPAEEDKGDEAPGS